MWLVNYIYPTKSCLWRGSRQIPTSGIRLDLLSQSSALSSRRSRRWYPRVIARNISGESPPEGTRPEASLGVVIYCTIGCLHTYVYICPALPCTYQVGRKWADGRVDRL